MIDIDKLKSVCGIYSITHIQTGRRYIGSSVGIGGRLKGHIKLAKRGSLMCIHRAMREFGIEAFDFEFIEQCERHLLLEREEFWIVFYNSASIHGFNTVAKPTSPNYGYSASDATRERISASRKGYKHTDEAKNIMSEKAKGRIISEQQRLKISTALKQNALLLTPEERAIRFSRPMTEDHKRKIGDAHRGRKYSTERLARGFDHLKGHKLSEETKSKMSASQKGRIVTDEHRAKISATLTGKKLSPESIAKRTATRKRNGYKHSEETRAKMSAAYKVSLEKPGRKEQLALALDKMHTPESWAKISASQIGKKMSPESTAKSKASNAARRAAQLRPQQVFHQPPCGEFPTPLQLSALQAQ